MKTTKRKDRKKTAWEASRYLLDKLHNQTSEIAAPQEKKDKALMKVLGSWAGKGTDEYQTFTRKGAGPVEYLANHYQVFY